MRGDDEENGEEDEEDDAEGGGGGEEKDEDEEDKHKADAETRQLSHARFGHARLSHAHSSPNTEGPRPIPIQAWPKTRRARAPDHARLQRRRMWTRARHRTGVYDRCPWLALP